MNQDWYFKEAGQICNVRVAGVVIKEGHLLVQKEKDGEIYALPGGHLKMQESSKESLVREFKEELGIKVQCEHFLWSEECCWEWNHVSTNTIIFYYLVTLLEDDGIPFDTFVAQKDHDNVWMGWIPIHTLPKITIYPSFIKEEIHHLANQNNHFMTKE